LAGRPGHYLTTLTARRTRLAIVPDRVAGLPLVPRCWLRSRAGLATTCHHATNYATHSAARQAWPPDDPAHLATTPPGSP